MSNVNTHFNQIIHCMGGNYHPKPAWWLPSCTSHVPVIDPMKPHHCIKCFSRFVVFPMFSDVSDVSLAQITLACLSRDDRTLGFPSIFASPQPYIVVSGSLLGPGFWKRIQPPVVQAAVSVTSRRIPCLTAMLHSFSMARALRTLLTSQGPC